MTFKNIKFKALAAIALAGILVSSCFEKFDEEGYNPPFTINGFSSSSEIKSANLVGYWPFNGSLTDSVSNLEGTAVGTTFEPGFVGQSLRGGLNSYAITNTAPGTAVKSIDSFTLAMWVNTPPPSTGIIGLFSLTNDDEFWGNLEVFFENGSSPTSAKLRVHINNGAGDTEFAMDGAGSLHNNWANITITYDGATGTMILYANGTKANTVIKPTFGNVGADDSGQIVFGTAQFMTDPSIGCCGPQGWASYLTGRLDEVRLYNAVLTEKEVRALIVLQGKNK